MRFLIPVLFLFLPCALQAQTSASYTYIDPMQIPLSPRWLTAQNLPRVGQRFDVTVPASTPTESYTMILGTRRVDLVLDLVLGCNGGFGCYYGNLLVWPEFVLPTPNGSGMVTMSFQIPPSPNFLGVPFLQQVYGRCSSLHAGCAVGGIAISRAGVGVIGS